MKWDKTAKNAQGTVIRESYFIDQDGQRITLRDVGGRHLSLEDDHEFIYATAEHRPGRWAVTIRDGKTSVQITKYKDDAIDLILAGGQS